MTSMVEAREAARYRYDPKQCVIRDEDYGGIILTLYRYFDDKPENLRERGQQIVDALNNYDAAVGLVSTTAIRYATNTSRKARIGIITSIPATASRANVTTQTCWNAYTKRR